MKSFEITSCICPYCNSFINSCISIDESPPKAGDISLCVYCKNISIYNKDSSLRKPSKEELEEIMFGEFGILIFEMQYDTLYKS
jgi:hypothetical protein